MGGSKGGPTIQNPYELDELVAAQEQMNRFDAENDFGFQRWETLPDGRKKLVSGTSPELKEAIDKNIAFANQAAPRYVMNAGLRDAGMSALGGLAQRAGLGGGALDGLQRAGSDFKPQETAPPAPSVGPAGPAPAQLAAPPGGAPPVQTPPPGGPMPVNDRISGRANVIRPGQRPGGAA